jgi:hypothetical protein
VSGRHEGNRTGRVVVESQAMAHPVLDTVLPVVRDARDVSLDLDRLAEHAGWMAYEELPPPAFLLRSRSSSTATGSSTSS